MPPGEPATSSNSLSTGPGQTCVTVTPVPERSARIASLKPATKCMLPTYAAAFGRTVSPAPDPMLSTPPRPCFTMSGASAAVSCATANMLVPVPFVSASNLSDRTIPNCPIPRCLPIHLRRQLARILPQAASRSHARPINPPSARSPSTADSVPAVPLAISQSRKPIQPTSYQRKCLRTCAEFQREFASDA